MNRLLPFRCRDSVALASILLVAASALTNAQPQTVVALSGIVFRFHGDTVWRARDTTSAQSVFRGDTLFRTTYVFGRKTGSEIVVVRGDSAIIVETRDGAGKLIPSTRMKGITAASIDLDRTSIEAAFRNIEMEESRKESDAHLKELEERALAMGRNLPPRPVFPTVDYSPKVKQVYPLTANRTLEQLADTVRYINGCTAQPPVDTTVYLLFGTDSARRVSPSPRTFDAMMARAIRGDVNSGFLRQRARVGESAGMKGVPTFQKWPCDLRP